MPGQPSPLFMFLLRGFGFRLDHQQKQAGRLLPKGIRIVAEADPRLQEAGVVPASVI